MNLRRALHDGGFGAHASSSSSLPTMSVGYFPGGKSAADTTATVPVCDQGEVCPSNLRRCVETRPSRGALDSRLGAVL